MSVEELVTVETQTVACDGNGPQIGHPRVYLTFKPGEKEMGCPYCSRRFRLSDDAKDSGHH